MVINADVKNNKQSSSDVLSMNALIRLQNKEQKECSSCHSTIGKFETITTVATVGEVKVFCEACTKEKETLEMIKLNQKPIVSKKEIISMVCFFLFSSSIVFIKPLWYVPPFLFTVYVMEAYRIVLEIIDRRQNKKILNYYEVYGSYEIPDKVRTRYLSAEKRPITTVEDATKLQILIYDMRKSLEKFFGSFFYLRLVGYCLIYVTTVITTLAFFYWLSNLVN